MNGKIIGLIVAGMAAALLLFSDDKKSAVPVIEKVEKEETEEITDELDKQPEKSVQFTSSRGLRNNNPGNIIKSENRWQGLVPKDQETDTKFCEFLTVDYGIRALTKILIAYYYSHHLTTISGIIKRYAPSNENDTNSYIDSVAKQTGIEKDTMLNFPEDIQPLINAIIYHENGSNPYTVATIESGLFMGLA